MESWMTEAVVSQGIWAVIAVFLLTYIVKSNEKRDTKQEEREKAYQTIISQLAEQLGSLNEVRDDVKEMKAYLMELSKEKPS